MGRHCKAEILPGFSTGLSNSSGRFLGRAGSRLLHLTAFSGNSLSMDCSLFICSSGIASGFATFRMLLLTALRFAPCLYTFLRFF